MLAEAPVTALVASFSTPCSIQFCSSRGADEDFTPAGGRGGGGSGGGAARRGSVLAAGRAVVDLVSRGAERTGRGAARPDP